MTIASALTALNIDITNARDAITAKGGTVTSGGGSSQLATDIATIPNGYKYGVNVDAFLGDTAANGTLSKSSNQTGPIFSGVTNIANQALYYKFIYSNITSVSFPDLENITGQEACYEAFSQCKKLESVSFPELTTISGNYPFTHVFSYCKKLTTISFPKLTSITGNQACESLFYGCTGLTDIYFPALTTGTFGSSYTSQFGYIMSSTGKTVTHTIHFPSNMESTISGLSGYPLFGGTSGYVVLSFDLPATS